MSAIQKFATDGIAPAGRINYWNDLVERTYAGTWVNSQRGDFSAEMWRWKVGDLDMIRPRSSPSQVGRAACDAAEDMLVLHLQRRGISRHRQDRHQAELAPGDFVLMSTQRPYLIDLPGANELLVVQFPRRLIEHKVRGLDDRLGRAISGASAGGRVFHDFLLSLWHQGDQSQADPDWQAGVTAVFADLAALAANAAPAPPCARGTNPTRERVLALVASRLSDPDLRTATIAGELGITARTVQNVFAAMGTTPGAHVAEQRLARAAERLTASPDMSVTDIAFDLGFNDSAYFSRCFRQRYGRTPSAWRHEA